MIISPKVFELKFNNEGLLIEVNQICFPLYPSTKKMQFLQFSNFN